MCDDITTQNSTFHQLLWNATCVVFAVLADKLISNEFKGVMTRSMVDAPSELCFPFLKSGNSAFIAAIASGLFPQTNIGHSNNYRPNRNKMGSDY